MSLLLALVTPPVSGTLTASYTDSTAAYNVSTQTVGGLAVADWKVFTAVSTQEQKSGATLISDYSVIGSPDLRFDGGATQGTVASWTSDGTPTASGSNAAGFRQQNFSDTDNGGMSVTLSVGTSVRKARIYIGRFSSTAGASRFSGTFTLSDGSASPVTVNLAGIASDTDGYFDLSFNAGSAGQTLLVEIRNNAIGVAELRAINLRAVWLSVEDVGATVYTLTCLTGSYSLSGNVSALLKSKLVTAQSGTYSTSGNAASINKSKLITAQTGAYALNGQNAALLKSKLVAAQSGNYAVTGNAATALKSKVLTAQAGNYAVTGNATAILKSKLITALTGNYSTVGYSANLTWSGGAAVYTLTCLTGTYNLSGTAASVLKSKLVTAQAGNYSVTGQSATVLKSKLITAQTGNYSLTGVITLLRKSKLVLAQSGSYVLAGTNASILKSKLVSAVSGTYGLTGNSATILKSKVIAAQSGNYSISGIASLLLKSKRLIAQAGAYSLSGNNANLVYTPATVVYTLTCLTGNYNLSGKNVSLLKSKKISAETGSYSVSGKNASLTWQNPNAATQGQRGGVYNNLQDSYRIQDNYLARPSNRQKSRR